MAGVVDVLRRAAACGVKVQLLGNRLKMQAPRRPPDDVVRGIKLHAAEIVHLLRADQGNGVPKAWLGELEKLRSATVRAPPGFDRDRLLADAETFIERWGAMASRLGWRVVDILGLDPNALPARFDRMGLAFLIAGREVIAIGADSAVVRTARGSVTYYRHALGCDTVPIWQLTQ